MKMILALGATVLVGLGLASAAERGEQPSSMIVSPAPQIHPAPQTSDASILSSAAAPTNAGGGPARLSHANAPLPSSKPQTRAPRRLAVDPAPWYARDTSLRKGDIVVIEGGALVFEGLERGKLRFRTVSLSRLVTKTERDLILRSVGR